MLLYRRAGFSLASTAVVIVHQSFLVIWIFNFYIIINIFFLYLTHSLYSNEPQSQVTLPAFLSLCAIFVLRSQKSKLKGENETNQSLFLFKQTGQWRPGRHCSARSSRSKNQPSPLRSVSHCFSMYFVCYRDSCANIARVCIFLSFSLKIAYICLSP